MKMCQDCKSNNIVDVEVYHAYFREGDWMRLRAIIVYENLNSEPKGFIASCPELSKTATSIGETPEQAIYYLTDILEKMGGWKCLGKKIEEE